MLDPHGTPFITALPTSSHCINLLRTMCVSESAIQVYESKPASQLDLV